MNFNKEKTRGELKEELQRLKTIRNNNYSEKHAVTSLMAEQKKAWLLYKIPTPLEERIALIRECEKIDEELEKSKQAVEKFEKQYPEFIFNLIELDARAKRLQNEYWTVTKAILENRNMTDLLEEIKRVAKDRVDNNRVSEPVEDPVGNKMSYLKELI